jgi:D-alanyl-D-alanine carboxypeptidase
MAGHRYGYTHGRGRPARREWLVAVPLLIAVLAVALGLRLPEHGGQLLGSSFCTDLEKCAPGVSISPVCASGSDCETEPSAASDEEAAAAEGEAQVTAPSYVVIEEPCGGVLYSQNAHDHRAPASLTKIATALVARERSPDLSAMVTANIDGPAFSLETDSTIMGLQPGQTVSLRDLLYGLLLPSGNDAALTIAEHVGGDVPSFVTMMNEEVKRLGLTDSHFVNPHGLDDPDHYTSAYDIAMLGRELIRQPALATIVREKSYQPAWDGPAVWNGNRLVYSYPGALGIKIGYTDEAQQTIVAAAERDGKRLIVAVLGSESVYDDAISLFESAFADEASACAGATVREPGAAPQAATP